MEWIAVILFSLLFVGAVMGEVLWLVRKGSATSGRAAAYVLATDLLGFGVGSFVISVIFFIMFMMVMGPAGTGGNAPEAAYWITTIIAIILPPALFILCKRVFLSFLRIQSVSPWKYSVTSSLLILAVIFVPPTFIFYLLASTWK